MRFVLLVCLWAGPALADTSVPPAAPAVHWAAACAARLQRASEEAARRNGWLAGIDVTPRSGYPGSPELRIGAYLQLFRGRGVTLRMYADVIEQKPGSATAEWKESSPSDDAWDSYRVRQVGARYARIVLWSGQRLARHREAMSVFTGIFEPALNDCLSEAATAQLAQ